jgi:hypothetical protein
MAPVSASRRRQLRPSEVLWSRGPINPFTKQPLEEPPDLEARIAEERRLLQEVRQRGAAALDLLVPYLRHPESALRTAVVEAFGFYPHLSGKLLPALRSALDLEDDAVVRTKLESTITVLTSACLA